MRMNSGWAAAGLGVVVLGVVVGSAPIVLIGAGMVLIRIIAERWPRRVLDSLTYERSVHPHKTVMGEEVELRMTLWNRTRLPIAWAGATDTLGDHLRLKPPQRSATVAGPMRPYERVTRRLHVTPVRRGVHEIGPVHLGVAEHFGTQVPKLDGPAAPAYVIARPLMAPVLGNSPQSAPLAQVRAKRSLFTDPTLFAGVRPYQAGDPLRSIHWRASAREGQTQTKRFEPALSRQQVIVIDVQTVEGPYWVLDYDEDLFEELCVAALSIARLLISQDASVGLAAAGFSFTTQRYVYVPPRADRAQIERIGDVLARITSESSAPLVSLLAWLPMRVPRGTTITILSGRSALTSATVVRRLEQSGFPVHFLLFRGGADSVAAARQAGIAALPATVESAAGRPTATGRPTAVVINA
jgi:uncharacterized protein (DUF58 family)